MANMPDGDAGLPSHLGKEEVVTRRLQMKKSPAHVPQTYFRDLQAASTAPKLYATRNVRSQGASMPDAAVLDPCNLWEGKEQRGREARSEKTSVHATETSPRHLRAAGMFSWS